MNAEIWHTVLMTKFNNTLSIFLDGFEIYKESNRKDIHDWSAGIVAFNGISPHFDGIHIGDIYLEKELQHVLFKDDATHKNEEEIKEDSEKKEVKEFRLKQLIKKKEEASNKSFLPEDSIENIKLICLYYHGTEDACTQAMIVYDKLVSGNEKIDDETLSSEIYRRCLNLSGSNVLGCSFAYKKALEVPIRNLFC